MIDLLITDGTIVDGRKQRPYKGDIAIIGKKIEKVGKFGNSKSRKKIDAKGMIVCPGFIDIHSHIDQYILLNSSLENKVRQGVTTEIGGNCGYSAFPWTENNLFYCEKIPKSGWRTFGEFLGCVENKEIPINYGSFIGHCSIREKVMKFENREPSKLEMKEMKKILLQAIDEGALGLSTGLSYAPGSFSKTGELIALSKELKNLKNRGGIYASHIRSEDKCLIESVKEAIEIAKKADVSVQISHLKTLGRNNWCKLEKVLSLIEKAHFNGLNALGQDKSEKKSY